MRNINILFPLRWHIEFSFSSWSLRRFYVMLIYAGSNAHAQSLYHTLEGGVLVFSSRFFCCVPSSYIVIAVVQSACAHIIKRYPKWKFLEAGVMCVFCVFCGIRQYILHDNLYWISNKQATEIPATTTARTATARTPIKRIKYIRLIWMQAVRKRYNVSKGIGCCCYCCCLLSSLLSFIVVVILVAVILVDVHLCQHLH